MVRFVLALVAAVSMGQRPLGGAHRASQCGVRR